MKITRSEESHYRVLQSPVVTEKATGMAEGMLGCGTSIIFNVASGATKAQIRAAVEYVFEVKVINVRTANLKGKPRNMRHRTGGNRFGKRPLQRRAYVRLAKGQDLDFLKLGGGNA